MATFIKNDRYVLLAAGSNSAGQLGLGHQDDSHIWQTCQLNDDQNDYIFPPIGFRIVQLSSGASHSIAILESDQNARQVWVCGSGADGQLGPRYWNSIDEVEKKSLFAFTRLDVDELLSNDANLQQSQWKPKLVQCGWDWTLIVLEDIEKRQDDLLFVLGFNNDFLQLGYNQNKNVRKCLHSIDLRKLLCSSEDGASIIHIESIACGLRHSLVVCSTVSEDKTRPNQYWLIGWGASRHGQIGKVQTLSAEESSTGNGSRKVALACLPRIIQRWKSKREEGEVEILVGLAAGKEHSAIFIPSSWEIVSDVSCCGFDDQMNGISKGIISFGSNRAQQCALNSVQSTLSEIPSGKKGVLGATWNGTFMIYFDSESPTSIKILNCGNNAKGQLGTKDTKSIYETESGHVHQLLIDHVANSAFPVSLQLACGSEHVALLLNGDNKQHISRVIGWGWNEHGNLAQNDEKDRHTPVQIWPPVSECLLNQLTFQHAKPVNVWAGCGTTFVQVFL